ncbi:MAG: hypothetical protein ABSB18_08270 [Candidatus Omnitrophota bacterium]
MPNKKSNPVSGIKNFFLHHPLLKIISLALAILIWFLVKEQITRFNL